MRLEPPGGKPRWHQLDHYHFFMDRFGPAFRAELEAFFGAAAEGKAPSPGVADALESLKIGLAATRRRKIGPCRCQKSTPKAPFGGGAQDFLFFKTERCRADFNEC